MSEKKEEKEKENVKPLKIESGGEENGTVIRVLMKEDKKRVEK